MIKSIKCKETERIFKCRFSKKLPQDIQRAALKKMEMLNAAKTFEDLKSPPSNRLEQLSGYRKGQYSIRINIQWRICFNWVDDNAENVEIVDYHK